MKPRSGDALVALPSQTVGPFFHFGLTDTPAAGIMATDEVQGERVSLTLWLLDGAGAPVADGMFELWQADAAGAYRAANPGFNGFGRLATNAHGACTFETIRPGRIADAKGGSQSPHINVIVFSRGLLHHLFTRIYFEDDPTLGSDPVLAQVPPERRYTLIARRSNEGDASWTHLVRLQGDDETVFFDL